MGMIVALGVLIAAIWMLAIYDTIQDAHEEKYDVSVRPGAVSYGTHSSATIPMVSSPMHSTSAPMISGSAVRSYAHNGHASMPSSAVGSGFKMHTTSSATVHTVGSGGGASGGGSSASGGQGTSSRGITYGGASVSMPTLALATPVHAATWTSAEKGSTGGGPRKVMPTSGGDDGEWRYGGNTSDPANDPGDWWYYDDWAGVWIPAADMGICPDGEGNFWKWDGSSWTHVNDQGDPVLPTPLGDAPWHWILLLALAYGIAKMVQRKQNAIQ